MERSKEESSVANRIGAEHTKCKAERCKKERSVPKPSDDEQSGADTSETERELAKRSGD